MGRARLGVALLIAGDLGREIDGLRRALGDPSLGRVPPHLTLVPPVNVPEGRLHEALARLRSAAAGEEPFELALGPPASFLPVNPVVHLPVTGPDGPVLRLREAVFRAPLARTVALPFVPHVTLADGAPPERVDAALAALADFEVRAAFDRVHLLREGAGRRWEPVAEAALAAPAVVGRGGLELELSVTAVPDVEAGAFAAAEGGAGAPFAVTARRGGAVVGVVAGRSDAATSVVEELVVAAGHRGEGIGSHLLAAVESLAAERGCTALEALVPADGPVAAFLAGRGWIGGPGSPSRPAATAHLRRRLG